MNTRRLTIVDFRSFIAGAAVLGLLCGPTQSGADTITSLPAEQASKVVVLRDAAVRDNVVIGEIVNNSPNRVRDVELLIRQVWHWRNEFRPGPNPPGAADYYAVRAEIPSGATERFTYTVPSLPPRSDGYFETVVTVAGFTEIKEPSQDQKNINDWRPVL